MSKQKDYQVIFNLENKPKRPKHFKYKCSSTEITLELSKNFIDISMSMKAKNVDFDNIFQFKRQGFNAYLNDAIKKAFLIHIIKYSKHIHIRKVTAKIDEDEKVIFDNNSENFPIFSLINGSLKHKFPESWKNSQEICEAILSRRKSSFNSLDSALFALIYAKSKEYETERLVYLWMAMNGMYNHFVSMCNRVTELKYINSKNKIKEYSTVCESNQMKIFSMFHDWGNDIVEGENKKIISREIISILTNYKGNISEEQLLPDENGEYQGELAKALKKKLVKKWKDEKGNEHYKPYDITPYGYLMLGLPYYYRCNVFHANKPVYMFAYADENDIKVLNIINNLLEHFLEKELFEWFKDEFVLSLSNNNKDYSQISSNIKDGIIRRFDGVMIENHYKKTD